MPDEKRVAIVQSNYVPWRGYFDLIASVDEFILLDDAQYTRRDWRNRNKIKTSQGSRWLTIAVEVSGRYTQSIYDTQVAEPDWAKRHWDIIRQHYARAAGFQELGGFVEELYASVPGPGLTHVNRHFLERITSRLGIDTPLTLSIDYEPQGVKTERLLDLCLKAGATEYVSGPAARAYLEEERFNERGISVSWFEYGPYAEYDQIYPPFDPQVSILDVLLCAGGQAAHMVRALKDVD
jgi:WbqC-like protein family